MYQCILLLGSQYFVTLHLAALLRREDGIHFYLRGTTRRGTARWGSVTYCEPSLTLTLPTLCPSFSRSLSSFLAILPHSLSPPAPLFDQFSPSLPLPPSLSLTPSFPSFPLQLITDTASSGGSPGFLVSVFQKLYGSQAHLTIVRYNDFSDIAAYFVQKVSVYTM